ncbi:MAG: GrpB family protein [Planctomycetes bacterium]|nr:GrpB family protein [Planctomycetota bacterium]
MTSSETLQDKVERVVNEPVRFTSYNPHWPDMFDRERELLIRILPDDLINRVEHFGSTAVPGLPAKPVIDILVEVSDLDQTRQRIVPVLEDRDYEYFWRPTWGDDTPPFYAWFIKRDAAEERTHHIHMVEPDFPHWDRLLFRDYLIDCPEVAQEYATLKRTLYRRHRDDRIAYTEGKTDFVKKITDKAREYYRGQDLEAGSR